MTHYLSDKIKILSFFLIILVLYIHSGFHANEINGMYLNHFIQDLIGGKIGRLAVPLFFMISGYLFFLKTENGIVAIYLKIKSRVRSILVPYILSSIFFVVFFLLIMISPGITNYVNSDIPSMLNISIPNLLKNMFWMGDNNDAPLAFHLWFLRDLILIVAISPLLFFFVKYLKWWLLPLLLALSTLTFIPDSLLSSLFWFSIGAVFALTHTRLGYNKSKWGFVILFIYFTISLVELVRAVVFIESVNKLLVILGVIGVWLSYDALVSRNYSLKDSKYLSFFCSYTFFIYLFHEPTLNIVRKVIVIVIGKSSFGYLISYLLSPFIFILSAVLIGMALKKYIPQTYSLLVGGRV